MSEGHDADRRTADYAAETLVGEVVGRILEQERRFGGLKEIEKVQCLCAGFGLLPITAQLHPVAKKIGELVTPSGVHIPPDVVLLDVLETLLRTRKAWDLPEADRFRTLRALKETRSRFEPIRLQALCVDYLLPQTSSIEELRDEKSGEVKLLVDAVREMERMRPNERLLRHDPPSRSPSITAVAVVVGGGIGLALAASLPGGLSGGEGFLIGVAVSFAVFFVAALLTPSSKNVSEREGDAK